MTIAKDARDNAERAADPERSPDTSGTGHRTAPTHVEPADVSLQEVLTAVGDPIRRELIRQIDGSGDWRRACGSFDVPVAKTTLSHHFSVLRGAGLIEQRSIGARRLNRLRKAEFDVCFPGLLDLVLARTD